MLAAPAAAPALHAARHQAGVRERNPFTRRQARRALLAEPCALHHRSHRRAADRAPSAARRHIIYFNNSPDPLPALNFKLFLNIHKPGAARSVALRADYLTSGTHIDAFTVNGLALPLADDPRVFTNRMVKLPTPLAPHDSVRLSFDWHYDISRQADREGMTRFHDVLPRVLLSACRRVRRLQRLGPDGLHGHAGVLQRLQRLRRDDQRSGELRRLGNGHLANAAAVLQPAALRALSRRRSPPTR